MKLSRKVSRRAVSASSDNGNNAKPRKVADRDESLAALVPFWQNLELITQYQQKIMQNLMPPGWAAWHELIRLAPSRLSQSILPWSFSAFQFTNEIQGDPEIEYKILTRVAGYGSQLGTIMDFLEVMAKRIHPQLTSGQTNPDLLKVLKFYDLLQKIDKAKTNPDL